jgi:hypothetical protein
LQFLLMQYLKLIQILKQDMRLVLFEIEVKIREFEWVKDVSLAWRSNEFFGEIWCNEDLAIGECGNCGD